MKTAIIITTPDFAGLNIKKNLLDNYEFEKTGGEYKGHDVYALGNITMYTIDKKCVFCEKLDEEIEADLFIFPTTHRSSAGTNSLSCHTQGNWGEADLGGAPRNLSYAPALILKEIFQELNNRAAGLDEEITMECTHHGPQIEKPTVFLEIGSDETQWKRPELGRIMADVLMKVLNQQIQHCKTAIGIGGPHYCNNFNKIQLNSEIAIGHICPKYALEHLDKEMIEQAIEKTVPKPAIALLDWKGLGQEKQRIVDLLNEVGIEIMRTNQIEK